MSRYLVALLLLALVSAAKAQTPEPRVRTYIVVPGDSVWSIAAEFYGSGDAYPVIYQYNDFAAKPPFLLVPGQVLRLPILGQGPEAEIAWLLKDVKAKPPRAIDWLEARARMNLWRLYRVATGDESAAHIVFEDRTDLKLREKALLVIYGASASAARTSRREKVEVRLEQGTIQGGLAALDQGGPSPAPLVVKTPSGQVDLLATLAQVQAELTESMVSVYDGQATVKAQGAAVAVQGDQGTVVRRGKKPEPARPLPLAPRWVEGHRSGLVAVVGGEGATGSWEAAWSPAERAATYRVELAADEAFKQVLFDAEIGLAVTRLRLADLAPGRYHVRVSTRDRDQLESRPGEARLVLAVLLRPARALVPGADGVLESAGFAGLTIDPALQERVRFAIDDGPEQPGSALIGLGSAGLHRVTLRLGEAETVLPIRILGLAAHLEVPSEPVPATSDARVKIALRVRDERGREAFLPGLVLESSTGETLPLSRTTEGYVATLPPTRGLARLALRARWAGGELVTRTIALAQPIGEERGRRPLAMGPRLTSRLAPGPLLAPRPETRLAFDTALVHRAGAPDTLALSFAGELGLGDLGLSADLTAQELRLSEGDRSQSSVQDLSLAARYALRAGSVVLSPYLRVALPLGSGDGEGALFGLEPGALLRLDAGAAFFDARLALLHASDFGARSESRASLFLAASWRADDLVSLSLSGETVVDLGGGPTRTLLGLGANLHLGDLRLGLALGLGLGHATREDLGNILGRLVIDVGTR